MKGSEHRNKEGCLSIPGIYVPGGVGMHLSGYLNSYGNDQKIFFD